MKKVYFIAIIINLITITSGLVIFFNFSDNLSPLIGIIFIGVLLTVGILQFENRNDKILKELYDDFDKEYGNKLVSELDDFIVKFENNKDYKLTPDQKKIAIDYLNSRINTEK